VAGLSGLTKKSVYADKTLSKLLGVSEGTHVSYAELSRGLHKYIKDNDLKNPQLASTSSEPSETSAPPTPQRGPAEVAATKGCRNCEAEIPVAAVFCDLCGARQ